MFIVKILSFLLLQPGYAEVSISTATALPVEVDSRDARFESDIAEAERKINELARKNSLSNAQKAALYRKEAEKALSRDDSGKVNEFSRLMASEEKAIVFFSKEIELSPNPQAFHLRGVAYKQLRQYENAIKDFSAAINFKDEKGQYPFEYSRAEAYRLRGMVYMAQKDYPGALADLTAAIAQDPRGATYSYGDRCAVYLKMGSLKEAAKDAEDFFKSPLSGRDKERFSKSGQCQTLAEAGVSVKGCKSLEYFKEWGKEMAKRAANQEGKSSDDGK
jgi:tetratricopeptide (TPR) repeat protein